MKLLPPSSSSLPPLALSANWNSRIESMRHFRGRFSLWFALHLQHVAHWRSAANQTPARCPMRLRTGTTRAPHGTTRHPFELAPLAAHAGCAAVPHLLQVKWMVMPSVCCSTQHEQLQQQQQQHEKTFVVCLQLLSLLLQWLLLLFWLLLALLMFERNTEYVSQRPWLHFSACSLSQMRPSVSSVQFSSVPPLQSVFPLSLSPLFQSPVCLRTVLARWF